MPERLHLDGQLRRWDDDRPARLLALHAAALDQVDPAPDLGHAPPGYVYVIDEQASGTTVCALLGEHSDPALAERINTLDAP